jgi:subtilase family serine protease
VTFKPQVETLEGRSIPSAALPIGPVSLNLEAHLLGFAGPVAYTPDQIRHGYGLPSTATGKGQTIAVIGAFENPTIQQDYFTFNKTFGLPQGSFRKVNLGVHTVDPGWSIETALDVEWAHAMAPRANIVLVEAKSSFVSDLLDAVDYASVKLHANVVSMSWGSPEFDGEDYYDGPVFFGGSFAHPNVTYLAASGDSPQVSWPAISPRVLGIGGTTLRLDIAASPAHYLGESLWPFAGRGKSHIYKHRTSPDFSMVADPNTGVRVLASGVWYGVGGTSVACPIAAGETADLFRVAGVRFDTASDRKLLQRHPGDFRKIGAGTGEGSPLYAKLAGEFLAYGRAHRHKK